MERANVAVVGTGWIGAIRAQACSDYPRVGKLHLADVDAAVGARVAREVGATSFTTDYRELLTDDLDAVIVSAAPETTHYPIARDALMAGQHVLLEKPMGLTLDEADDLIALAIDAGVKFTVGYTQRFRPRFAYVKHCVEAGTLGRPVTALVSRHLTRAIGKKIAGRGQLGPAQMEATHDIDLVLWWMDRLRPVRVYAQSSDGVMRADYDLPDSIWIMVTLDNGNAFTIGANWNLPLENPGFSGASMELICTEGSLFVDDSHRDIMLTTTERGLVRPLSTMPGEQVDHVFRGPMVDETIHFIDALVLDRPVLVTPEQARTVMEVTLAADLSVERARPVDLPLGETYVGATHLRATAAARAWGS